jgi:hypothetical protein
MLVACLRPKTTWGHRAHTRSDKQAEGQLIEKGGVKVITGEKWKFIESACATAAIAAALQRSGTYRDGTSGKKREEIRESLREHLFLLRSEYKERVSEEQHIRNIRGLAEEMTDKYQEFLSSDGFKIGVAQKAINLYLKYLWCLGVIEEPPHCPLDRSIISRLKANNDVNWTELTKIEVYEALMDEIGELARNEGRSIAEWELIQYNGT